MSTNLDRFNEVKLCAVYSTGLGLVEGNGSRQLG